MKINQFVQDAKQALSIKPFHSSAILSAEQEKQNKQAIKFLALFASMSLIALEPQLALATVNPFDKVVTNIVTAITGTFGQGIATLAVIVFGVMAMFGKLAWDTAVKLIIGIVIVFSAATLVGWIAGDTTIDKVASITPVTNVA